MGLALTPPPGTSRLSPFSSSKEVPSESRGGVSTQALPSTGKLSASSWFPQQSLSNKPGQCQGDLLFPQRRQHVLLSPQRTERVGVRQGGRSALTKHNPYVLTLWPPLSKPWEDVCEPRLFASGMEITFPRNSSQRRSACCLCLPPHHQKHGRSSCLPGERPGAPPASSLSSSRWPC